MQAAQLRAAAAGIEISAFGKDGDFGNARGAAMSEDLDDTRDGVGAIDGGFGAADDFDFVDVVEGKLAKSTALPGSLTGVPSTRTLV